MEIKYTKAYYPTWLLLITGFFFLLFSLLLDIVGGLNPEPALWIGLISLCLGLLIGTATIFLRSSRKK